MKKDFSQSGSVKAHFGAAGSIFLVIIASSCISQRSAVNQNANGFYIMPPDNNGPIDLVGSVFIDTVKCSGWFLSVENKNGRSISVFYPNRIDTVGMLQEVLEMLENNYPSRWPFYYSPIGAQFEVRAIDCKGVSRRLRRWSYVTFIREYVIDAGRWEEFNAAIEVGMYKVKFLYMQKIEGLLLSNSISKVNAYNARSRAEGFVREFPVTPYYQFYDVEKNIQFIVPAVNAYE